MLRQRWSVYRHLDVRLDRPRLICGWKLDAGIEQYNQGSDLKRPDHRSQSSIGSE